MEIHVALKTIHVCANLFWIGSIVAVASILRVASSAAAERGRIVLVLYRTLATPAFIVSFIAATALLLLEPAYYFVQTHMMHAKLPVALGVVALHHWLGFKAKRMSVASATPPGSLLVALLVAGALGAAVLALLKPF